GRLTCAHAASLASAHGNRWSAHCGRGAAKIGMLETLRLGEAISIEFKTWGPGEVHRYSGSHLAVSGGPPTPPVRWAGVNPEKHPPAGSAGGCVFRKIRSAGA